MAGYYCPGCNNFIVVEDPCDPHGHNKGCTFLAANQDRKEAREILVRLVSLCPDREGLGGRAPIAAFLQLGERARAFLIKTNSRR